MGNIIDEIRLSNASFVNNENFEGFKDLVVNNYNDSAHFVYELLQNADDAKATKIIFDLHEDILKVSHNGIDFSKEDVKAICSISLGTKKDDNTKIGRFGIGFKSVFSYTKNPKIYSGNYSFEINDLILPHNISPINAELGTTFVIELNNRKDIKSSLEQIETKFKKMEEDSILFLSNIQEIEIITDNVLKTIIKERDNYTIIGENQYRENWNINIVNSDNGQDIKKEKKYLAFVKEGIDLFDEDAQGNKMLIDNQKIAIAYLMENNELYVSHYLKRNNYYVFFPTMIANDYPFLIHAPFVTKFSREIHSLVIMKPILHYWNISEL